MPSQHICYLWLEDDHSVGVFPPQSQNPLWRIWLIRQDARKRRFISTPAPGYWVLDHSLMPKIQERCVEVGWVVYNNKPGFIKSSFSDTGDSSPFNVFYLLSTAPKEVVDVVYRHFIRKVHTDIGGDNEKAVLYNNAKDDIYKLKGW